jgi:plastocyanin
MARRGWPGLFAVCGVVVFAVVEAAAVAAASAPVAAVNYEFNPSSLTVSVGDTVVWTMSGDGHTVRSGTVGADNIGHPSDGPFDSGFKGPGESYSFTFAQAGTYQYFCEIHPEQMKGTITVIAAPSSASAPGPIASAQSAAAATPAATAGAPSPAAATPEGSKAPTADARPVAAAGILIAIAIAGLVLALRRRNR